MTHSFTSFESPGVRGFLHRPASGRGAVLVLTHGAGSNCNAPLLIGLASALAESGMAVLRCDLPFRQARPKGPPSAGAANADREGLRMAVESMKREFAGPVFLGGHSYGGRQASMLAASHPGLAQCLLLLSYPLHPPRRPAQPRTAHFPELRTPALFVHGTRDPFGSVEELRAALQLIPARCEMLEAPGAGHDLTVRRREAGVIPRIASVFLEFAGRFPAAGSQNNESAVTQ